MIQDFMKRSDPVAVLVDGDNLSHDHTGEILAHAAKLGQITFRRVYGNMATLLAWDADPRFRSVHAKGDKGKNNADIRLVIDAMDLALSGRPHSFVIASGDSDFAPLAERLREAGHLVVGIGGENAAAAFQAACSQFHKIKAVEKVVAKQPAPKLDLIEMEILHIMRAYGDSAACINLSLLGTKLSQLATKVTARDAGSATWSKYLQARAWLFVVEKDGTAYRARPLPILAHLP